MPDWRNPADYEYTAKLTLHQWAWEFLRRNPEYCRRWKAIMSRDADTGTSVLKQINERITLGGDFGLLMAADPVFRFSDALAQWSIGTGVKVVVSAREAEEILAEWPDLSQKIMLIFDLSEDLRPQLQHAEWILPTVRENIQRRIDHEPYRPTIRPQPDKYPIYVRALDGRAADASQRKIGKLLFPASDEPRDAARRALERADRLVAGGYRDLLYKADV